MHHMIGSPRGENYTNLVRDPQTSGELLRRKSVEVVIARTAPVKLFACPTHPPESSSHPRYVDLPVPLTVVCTVSQPVRIYVGVWGSVAGPSPSPHMQFMCKQHLKYHRSFSTTRGTSSS